MPRLADGRLHLQHGPIDLVIAVDAPDDARDAAYARVEAAFPGVLPGLVRELPVLRRPLEAAPSDVSDPIARRMIAACGPYAADFITPMAAVAGAVADRMLGVLVGGDGRVARAYVNNGGDIALHLNPAADYAIGVVADLARPDLFGRFIIRSDSPTRGVATSGWPGRSFSFGIADAVTVLAATAAEADAAATVIANAVDADDPAIRRAPASSIQDDSDLGDRLVTVAVPPLADATLDRALDQGAAVAEALIDRGLIQGAVLIAQGRCRVAGGPIIMLSPSQGADPREVAP